MADAVAFTSTPDGANGNPIDVKTVVTGAGTVDRQRVAVVNDAGPLSVDGSGVTQPVSGSVSVANFPATQAVSAASLPLPTGAATEATLATRLADVTFTGRINTQGQKTSAASTPVVIASDQTGVPVTSTGLTNLDVALSTRLKPADTLAGVTTVAAVTAITNALPAGTNRIGSVRPVDSADADLTSAKNTQTSRFVGVQRSIDAGRNTRIFMLDVYTAAPLVEALATVVQWYGNAAVAGTTTPAVVPAGKTLRLISWKLMYQSLSTAGYGVVRVRVNTGGVVILASPLVFSFEGGSIAVAAGALTALSGDFPEGLEIPAAAGIGFSIAGYSSTGTLQLAGGLRFAVVGYEY